MKKIILITLCLILGLSSTFAAMFPFYDESNVNYFTSPALLIEREESVPFGFEVKARSAFDYLSYLTSPSSSLTDASDYLYDKMMNGDLDFWNKNYESLKAIFTSFDNTPFPAQPKDEGSLAQLQAFLSDSYANRYSKEHKAQAVLSALNTTAIFDGVDSEPLYSNALLNLSMFGGKASNGFGWKVAGNIGFVGPENMLMPSLSLLDINIRANVGYALHLFSDKFTLGGALEVGAFMQNYMGSYNLLDARFKDDPILAFSNPFKFGLGFALNFGGMYRHNENLAFTLDLRNAVNFRSFWDLELTDFVEFNGFDRDKNVYYMPMDIAITALWDFNQYHIVVEFSDILNQFIWNNEMKTNTFDFFSIPKFRFGYDINDTLTLNTALQYSRLSFGVQWKELTAEISTSLNKAELGIKLGYKF